MQHEQALKLCTMALASIMILSVFSPAIIHPASAYWIGSTWSTPEPQSWTDSSKDTTFGVSQQIASSAEDQYASISIACDISDCAVHDHRTNNYDTLTCHIALYAAIKDQYRQRDDLREISSVRFRTFEKVNPSYTSIVTSNLGGTNWRRDWLPTSGDFSKYLTAANLAAGFISAAATLPLDASMVLSMMLSSTSLLNMDTLSIEKPSFWDTGIDITWYPNNDNPQIDPNGGAFWGAACLDLEWHFWRGAPAYMFALHEITLQFELNPVVLYNSAELVSTVTLRVTVPPSVTIQYPLPDQTFATGCSSMPLKVSVGAFMWDGYCQWDGVDIVCQKGSTATTYVAQYDSYMESWYANVILDSGTPQSDYTITARAYASSGAYFDTSIVVHVKYVSQPIGISISSPHDGDGFVTNGASYATITVTCVATAGQNCPPIYRVDVCVDGNWYSATHGSGDQWSATIPFSAGRPAIQHSIFAKATNAQGSTQSTPTIHISVVKGWPNVN